MEHFPPNCLTDDHIKKTQEVKVPKKTSRSLGHVEAVSVTIAVTPWA